jgi:hypothetical protein
MQTPSQRAWARLLLASAVALSVRTAAFADGTVTIHLANDSPDNLQVTLYDRNLKRHQMVMSGQVIYGNASISTTISADSTGQGHIYWTAITTDRDMRRCGHQEKRAVNDGETVHVTADGSCKRH